MNDIVIDSHVRIPRPKGQVEAERKNNKAFKAYADAYERVYVRRPTLNGVTKSGFFQIDTLAQAVNARRLKELTAMLKERAKDL